MRLIAAVDIKKRKPGKPPFHVKAKVSFFPFKLVVLFVYASSFLITWSSASLHAFDLAMSICVASILRAEKNEWRRNLLPRAWDEVDSSHMCYYGIFRRTVHNLQSVSREKFFPLFSSESPPRRDFLDLFSLRVTIAMNDYRLLARGSSSHAFPACSFVWILA